MTANKGQMPVLWPGTCTAETMGHDFVHVCMNTSTHLKFLCDWAHIQDTGIFSPGDFFVWAYDVTWMPVLAVWAALLIADVNRKNDSKILLQKL